MRNIWFLPATLEVAAVGTKEIQACWPPGGRKQYLAETAPSVSTVHHWKTFFRQGRRLSHAGHAQSQAPGVPGLPSNFAPHSYRVRFGPPSETDCRPIEDAAAFSWDASSVFSESVRIMKNMPEEFGFGFAFAFVVQGPYSCMSLLQRWPSFFSSCVPFQG